MAEYVSLGLDAIYGEFEWSDPEIARTDIADINAASGRLIAKLGEVRSYQVTHPIATRESHAGSADIATTQLKTLPHHKSKNTMSNFDIYLAEMKNVCVSGTRVYLVGQEMSELFEVHRAGDRPHQTPEPDIENLNVQTIEYQKFDHPTLLLTSAGSFNWGHFLADELPRLVAYVEWANPPVLSIAMISWPLFNRKYGFDKKRAAAIRTLYPDLQIEFTFINFKATRFFANLLYVTPNSVHPGVKSGPLIDLARTRFQNLNPAEKPDLKLLVLRTGKRNISRLQQWRLIRLFKRRGFTIIRPEKIPAADQFNLFSRASHVVGIHGAALTNTLFSPQGSKLLIIAPIEPSGLMDPFYLDLAHHVGMEYFVYMQARPDSETNVQANFNLDFPRVFDFAVESGFLN